MSSVYDALLKAGKKSEPTGARDLPWSALSLQWKITIAILGLVFVVTLNQLVARVLRDQMNESAAFITANLSDAAAGHLASKDVLQLKTTVTKYARLSRVAYVFIQDREGTVLAHSLATLPPELQQGRNAADHGLQVGRRELTLEGKPVYETRAPILDGQLGSAHIGIWLEAIEQDIFKALFTFLWPVTFGTLGAVIVAAILAQPSIRALRRLVAYGQIHRQPPPAPESKLNS